MCSHGYYDTEEMSRAGYSPQPVGYSPQPGPAVSPGDAPCSSYWATGVPSYSRLSIHLAVFPLIGFRPEYPGAAVTLVG